MNKFHHLITALRILHLNILIQLSFSSLLAKTGSWRVRNLQPSRNTYLTNIVLQQEKVSTAFAVDELQSFHSVGHNVVSHRIVNQACGSLTDAQISQ